MGQTKPIAQNQAPNKPVFYLLAGPNGAGKSTLYKALVLAGAVPSTAEFVNADLYEAENLQHIAQPQARSEQARLCQEAQAQGFFVMLLVVALDQPERLLERVAQRVTEGGHTHCGGHVQRRMDKRPGAASAALGTAGFRNEIAFQPPCNVRKKLHF